MGKLIAINISEKTRNREKKKYRKQSWSRISGLREMPMRVSGTGRSVFYLLKKSKIQSQRSQIENGAFGGESDCLWI